MVNTLSNPRIDNTIIWDNSVVSGAAIVNTSSAPSFRHCIVAESGGSQSWDPSVGVDAGGNLDVDPLFVDAPGDDYRLTAISPAVDAGDNDVPGLPAIDFTGKPRILNYVVDIGVHEFGDDPVAAFVQSYDAEWVDQHVEVRWTLINIEGSLDFDVMRKQGDGPFQFFDYVPVQRLDNTFTLIDATALRGNSYTYRVTVMEDRAAVTSIDIPVTTPFAAFSLEQNHPNPFNPTTTVSFSLSHRGNAQIYIYSVDGSLVRRLVDREMPAGSHEVVWDGRDDHGSPAASGVFFYRLTLGNRTLSRKAVLLR